MCFGRIRMVFFVAFLGLYLVPVGYFVMHSILGFFVLSVGFFAFRRIRRAISRILRGYVVPIGCLSFPKVFFVLSVWRAVVSLEGMCVFVVSVG